MNSRVEIHRFEDDGAHWTRVWERPARETSPSGLPYIGQGLSFCGNSQSEADARAKDFLQQGLAALEENHA